MYGYISNGCVVFLHWLSLLDFVDICWIVKMHGSAEVRLPLSLNAVFRNVGEKETNFFETSLVLGS